MIRYVNSAGKRGSDVFWDLRSKESSSWWVWTTSDDEDMVMFENVSTIGQYGNFQSSKSPFHLYTMDVETKTQVDQTRCIKIRPGDVVMLRLANGSVRSIKAEKDAYEFELSHQ